MVELKILSCPRRGTLRLVLVATVLLVPLAAAPFWETKKPADWSDEQVYALLTDSPWSKQTQVELTLEKPNQAGAPTWKELKIPGDGPAAPDHPIGSPVGGIGAGKPKVPRDAKLLIRWSSSQPVKEALARYKSGQNAAAPAFKDQPDSAGSFYVIEVLGVPAIAGFAGIQVLQDELYHSSGLITRNGRIIRPESVYATPQGEVLGITIRFPKTEPLTLDDKYVDCVGKTRVFSFRKRFELRPMASNGQLEL